MIAWACLILAEIGWTDGFVRFLRVLRLGLVNARLFGQISAIKTIRYGLARSRNGAVIHLHTIGPHISYCTVLVETLCNPHGMAGGKTELARSLLLQS